MSIKSFQNYLHEALLDVDVKDIDKIFAPMKKAMKELTDVWKEHGEAIVHATQNTGLAYLASVDIMQKKFSEVLHKHQPMINSPYKTFDSSILKSENARKAHAINPIKIHVWLVAPRGITNSYIPSKKEIHICLDQKVADAMMNRLLTVPNFQLAMLRSEVSDLKHKSTIRHELTHWIDDSLHNLYLRKNLNVVQQFVAKGDDAKARAAYKKMMAQGEEDIYLSPVEITPMVNQIDDYRKRIGQKKYDTLTWKQVCDAIPGVGHLNQTYGAYYRKKMFSRLARENLIGKNFMKKLS